MSQVEYNGMKCRLAGHCGLYLSEVGLGLWKWGDPSYDGSRVGERDGFAILDRALELGVFHWDTACSYNAGSGNSERLLGRYFASRGPRIREKVVLATKVYNSVRPEHVMDYRFTPNQSGGSRRYVRCEVERCLKRLQTDYIDVLYLHRTATDREGNYTTPLEETWGTMDDLVGEGKVHYLAVSNHSARQIAEVAAALEKVGKDISRRVVLVQNRYNLLEPDSVVADRQMRSPEDGTERDFLDFCGESGIGVVPFFPLARGLLTGRYRREGLDAAQGRIVDEGMQAELLTEANLAAVEGLGALTEQKGVTLAQLSIAWLLSRPQVTSVIAGVTKIEHLEDNAAAPQVELSEKDVARIDEIVRPAREARAGKG